MTMLTLISKLNECFPKQKQTQCDVNIEFVYQPNCQDRSAVKLLCDERGNCKENLQGISSKEMIGHDIMLIKLRQQPLAHVALDCIMYLCLCLARAMQLKCTNMQAYTGYSAIELLHPKLIISTVRMGHKRTEAREVF